MLHSSAGSGVSKHTLYAWKAKYGGMDVSQAQEGKQLRDENSRLRKLVADLNLDKEALQSVIRKTAGARSPEGGYRAGEARVRLQRVAGLSADDAGRDGVPLSQPAEG